MRLFQCEVDGSVRVVSVDVDPGELLSSIVQKVSNTKPWLISSVSVFVNGRTLPATISDPYSPELSYLFHGTTIDQVLVEDSDNLAYEDNESLNTSREPPSRSPSASLETETGFISTETENVSGASLSDLTSVTEDITGNARYKKTKFSQWIAANEGIFTELSSNLPQCIVQIPSKDACELTSTIDSVPLGSALLCLYRHPAFIPNVYKDTAKFALGDILRNVLFSLYEEEGFIPAEGVKFLIQSISTSLGLQLDKAFEAYLKQSVRNGRYRLKLNTKVASQRLAVRVAADPVLPLAYSRRSTAPIQKLPQPDVDELLLFMANLPGQDEGSIKTAFLSTSERRVRYILTDENATPRDLIIRCPGYSRLPLLTLRIDYTTRCKLLREETVDFQDTLRCKVQSLYDQCKLDDGFEGTDSLSIDTQAMVVFKYMPLFLLNKQKRFRINKPEQFVYHSNRVSYESALDDIKTRCNVNTAFIGVLPISPTITNYFVNFADCSLPADSFCEALEVFYLCHYVFHISYEPRIFLILTLLDRICGRKSSTIYQTIEDIVRQL